LLFALNSFWTKTRFLLLKSNIVSLDAQSKNGGKKYEI
jgi:hypothetical protein